MGDRLSTSKLSRYVTVTIQPHRSTKPGNSNVGRQNEWYLLCQSGVALYVTLTLTEKLVYKVACVVQQLPVNFGDTIKNAKNAKPEVVWSRDLHGNGTNR